jgi:hypothetical protein
MKSNNDNKLFENMIRFKTKNLALNEDMADGIIQFIKGLTKRFKQTRQYDGVLNDVFRMLYQDTSPETIIKFLQQKDPELSREKAIEMIKDIGELFSIYVDIDNDADASPTT